MPAIAYVLDMYHRTRGAYGVNEVILASALAAIVFPIFSVQPLTFVGVTGLINLVSLGGRFFRSVPGSQGATCEMTTTTTRLVRDHGTRTVQPRRSPLLLSAASERKLNLYRGPRERKSLPRQIWRQAGVKGPSRFLRIDLVPVPSS